MPLCGGAKVVEDIVPPSGVVGTVADDLAAAKYRYPINQAETIGYATASRRGLFTFAET